MRIALFPCIIFILFLLITGCSESSHVPTTAQGSTPSISEKPTITHRVTMRVTTIKTTAMPIKTITQESIETTAMPTKTITQKSIETTAEAHSVMSSDSGACNCSGNLYNCDDFKTQTEAQSCFEYCKSLGKGDIHKLDSNKDGTACENNK